MTNFEGCEEFGLDLKIILLRIAKFRAGHAATVCVFMA